LRGDLAGHALVKLAEFGPRQQFLELRLTDQYYLNQLFLLGLDIRQHPDLLEDGGLQVLGLVDNEHHVLAPEALLEQKPVQPVDQLLLCIRRGIDAEILVYRLQKLDFRQVGIEDDGAFGALVHLIEQVPAERGLAGADLARDDHEAAPLLDAVSKMRDGLLVLIAQVEILRVGCDIEGLLIETEKRLVHRSPPCRWACYCHNSTSTQAAQSRYFPRSRWISVQEKKWPVSEAGGLRP